MEKDSSQYSATWAEVRPLLKHEDIILDFLKAHKDDLNFECTKTFLSIGPGTGLIERDAIKSVLPNLDKFIALEPNSLLLQQLQENFKCFQNLQYDYQNSTLQEYEGPGCSVQLMLLSHSLYYVEDDLENQLQKCLQWLSTDGAMIIIIQTERPESMSSQLRKELWWANICIGSNVIEEALQKMKVQYKEHLLPSRVDVSTEAGRDFLYSLFLNRPCTDEERVLMTGILRKFIDPEKEFLDQPSSVFVVRKTH